jgi:hypothetical protein
MAIKIGGCNGSSVHYNPLREVKMWIYILAYFSKKYNPKQAQIEAIDLALTASLKKVYWAIDWQGW